MSEKDFAVGAVGGAPQGSVPSGAVYAGGVLAGSTISKKPSYLVTLEEGSGKNKLTTRFISIDKPDLLNGFIAVKGIFTEASEEEAVAKFNTILATTPKEQQIEVMFPWHKVSSIRSLVFNAVKSTTSK